MIVRSTRSVERTDLRGYPTLSAEEEIEETLAVEPKPKQTKKGKPRQEGE